MFMANKIIISIIAAAEVLTLFPLLFFGIYTVISSGDIAQKDTTSMFLTVLLALFYASSVLFGAYQAIQNISKKPSVSYLFLLLPIVVGCAVYYFNGT